MVNNINSRFLPDLGFLDRAQAAERSDKAASTSSGISNVQGTTPPAAASSSGQNNALTFAPTSEVSSSLQDGALNAAVARFSSASNALNPALSSGNDFSAKLSPLDATRALFKAVLESNQNQQDDELRKRKEAMEAARTQQLAQAANNRASAQEIESNATKVLALSLGSAAASAATLKLDTDAQKTLLATGAKTLDSLAAKTAASTQSDGKNSDAVGQIAAADAEAAKAQETDAKDGSDRLRQQFDQLFRALQEITEAKGQQLKAASFV